MGRAIEAHFVAQGGHLLDGGALAERFLRGVAGEQLGNGENHHAHQEERQQRRGEALGGEDKGGLDPG
jgi:hypothetical protein